MDRDQVDAWVSGVDDLLAGRRDDASVSEDAMRWSPQAPEKTGPLLPAAMWDACMRPTPHHVEALRAVEAQLAEVQAAYVAQLRPVMEAWAVGVQRAGQQIAQAFGALTSAATVANAPADPVARALEARRTRDTGPSVEPYRRRGLL